MSERVPLGRTPDEWNAECVESAVYEVFPTEETGVWRHVSPQTVYRKARHYRGCSVDVSDVRRLLSDDELFIVSVRRTEGGYQAKLTPFGGRDE